MYVIKLFFTFVLMWLFFRFLGDFYSVGFQNFQIFIPRRLKLNCKVVGPFIYLVCFNVEKGKRESSN